MPWTEFSCCGTTFVRQTRSEETPVHCPGCGRRACPVVRVSVQSRRERDREESRR
ncbi:MAG: hypothetical protein Tsb0017_20220 [Geothermobacteraceae bacterium]